MSLVKLMTERMSKECESAVRSRIEWLNSRALSIEGWEYRYLKACEALLAELDATRAELKDAHWVLDNINKRVFPGEVDSADALVQIMKERDALRAAATRAAETLEAGPLKLREVAKIYLDSKHISDHDCALELSAVLDHWVNKDALAELRKAIGE